MDERGTPPRAGGTAPALSAALAAGWLALRIGREVTRRVRGDSMRPTLSDGDLVLVVPAARHTLQRGDVVVIRDPRAPERETVKRVASLAGDLADVPDGPAPVPRGYVAVTGDDPTRSTDSRTYGAVPADRVVGRVVARVWPHPTLVGRAAASRTAPSADH